MRKALFFAAALLCSTSVFAQSHPVFFNDATSLARYAAMKANYDANPASPSGVEGKIYKFVKGISELEPKPYADQGQYGAYMYHWTGDAYYANRALLRIGGANLNSFLMTSPPLTCAAFGQDDMRENSWQRVLIYDFIYPALTAGQRATILANINVMIGCGSTSASRMADSDQTIGAYFAAAMWYVSTGSYNATAATIWNDVSRKIGGWDATTSDGDLSSTSRNAIAYYINVMSIGGEFLESTEYNVGTLKLLTIPNAALKTAGITKFPEIDAWQQDAALSFIHILTPGLATAPTLNAYQRLDNQVDGLHSIYRLEACFALAGVNVGTSVGPYIQDACLDYLGRGTLESIYPYPRGFLVFDALATRGDHTTLDRERFNSGQGFMTVHTGWTPADSMFGSVYSWNRAIDHISLQWGEFQLWKDGTYAIRHPIGYGGPSFDSRGSNALAIEGLPYSPGANYGALQYRKVRAHRNDFTNGFHYVTGTTGGAIVGSGTWAPIQTFIQEHTRSIVYLSGLDTVVVYDRANSDNAVTTGTGLPANVATWINSRPRAELYVHSPVAATLGVGTISYDYATGKGVRVTTLLPSSPTRTQAGPTPSTLLGFRYETRISPSNDPQKWNRFLNVWDAYGAGTPATVTLVQDTTNLVDASLVTRGASTYLLAFNAIQGPDVPGLRMASGFGYWQDGVDAILNTVRLRSSDFSLVFTTGQASKALLFDLNPIAIWTYTINGGASQDLTVDTNGIAVIDIATTGEITLAVTGEGGLPEPVVVTTTVLPDCVVGTAYSQAIAASGGDGGPYACTLDSGTLPAGLSLNAACATGITGTPEAADSANSLTKTASTAWGNAGAYSSNSLAAGDGYVETKAGETTTYRMIGLSKGNTNNDYTDIDYGLDIMGDVHTGQLRVYEGGVLKYQTTNGYYASGDLLRVAVVGGAVKYSKNGTVIYTSLTAPSYPLIVDTALYTLGSTLKNVVGDFGAGAVDVAWAAITGASGGGGSSRTFAIEVCDSTPTCADPQTYTLNIQSTPTITTLSLDAGVIGTAYSDTAAVSGGNDPYVWTLASGALPDGLSLAAATGVISGTPTVTGVFTFTLRVTDDDAAYDEQYYTVTVTSARTILTITSDPGPTSAVIHYGTVNASDSCVVTLYSGGGDTVLNTATSTGPGDSARRASFSGLTPLTAYGIGVVCDTADADRYTFSTLALPPVGGTVDWTYTLKPHASLLARGVTKVTVSYTLENQDPPEAAVTEDAACATGCTVTLPLLSGQIYSIQHIWKTAADAVVATSRAGLVAVP